VVKAIAASGYKNRNVACSLCDLPCLDNVYVLISEYLYVPRVACICHKKHPVQRRHLLASLISFFVRYARLTLCSCTKRPSSRPPFWLSVVRWQLPSRFGGCTRAASTRPPTQLMKLALQLRDSTLIYSSLSCSAPIAAQSSTRCSSTFNGRAPPSSTNLPASRGEPASTSRGRRSSAHL
jgi:hypothetical protein